eukprot:TRINITY_DN10242_c0_g1_i5.p1 TRINITY_DN10242_c0_g1~~TRINITY_DN10242_c0_g1_i5.p1  ORF type:complete len:179 (-),score=22.61 TRINITY_DN10242_c0_g1_i5:217-753(-)
MCDMSSCVRKRIVLTIVQKIEACREVNSERKRNFAATYVPFYDPYISAGKVGVKVLVKTVSNPLKEKKTIRVYTNRELKLKTTSEILSKDMLNQLGSKIAPLLLMREWEVVFRISSDGVSFRTFFTKVAKHNPTLLVVQDSRKTVFGAFATEKWKLSERFYGTGEAFLFSFKVSWEKR